MKWLRNKINQNINKIKRKIKKKMKVNLDQEEVKQLRNKIIIWLGLILREMNSMILKPNYKLKWIKKLKEKKEERKGERKERKII